MKYEFSYNDGYASCIIHYEQVVFLGEARCHPDDEDFQSEKTGLQIAEVRANIQYLQFKRDKEIKSQIKILKHLLGNIQSSKYHNPKNYESSMLRNQLKALEKELEDINEAIAEEKKFLKEYINEKDKFYKRIRSKKVNN